MRIAVLYDIHGNLPALDAVLEEVRREDVDLLMIGGDVYPGPLANECVERIRQCGIPHRAIAGNGERAVLETRDGKPHTELPGEVRVVIEWSAENLSPEIERELRDWPMTTRIEVAGLGRVLFVHATPANDVDIFTERTSDERLRGIFDGVDADVVFCGHTHLQFTRQHGGLTIVNPGSVGMPFGDAGAYWALVDGSVNLRFTPYALDDAAAQLRGSSYPTANVFVDRYVLDPPSREKMLDFYDRLENG
ncbi:MAG TPA: metallophosphoesterase family protein [Gemmatimonadaceae bacterium]|jgi:putative phosphoesterase